MKQNRDAMDAQMDLSLIQIELSVSQLQSATDSISTMVIMIIATNVKLALMDTSLTLKELTVFQSNTSASVLKDGKRTFGLVYHAQ